MSQRQPNESIKEYTLRLCENKEQLGLSWSDIATLINKESGEDYTESKYRKWYSAWKEGYEDGLAERLTGDEVLAEYEQKRVQLQKEKFQLQDQRRVYNNLIREQARFDHIVEQLRDSLDNLAHEKPIDWTYRGTQGKIDCHGLLLLSDLHYGLYVDSYFNRYNTDIFNQRMMKLLNETIEACLLHEIDTLHVMSLGDDVAGNIHISTRVHATENVVVQTQRVAEAKSGFLSQLSQHVPHVKHYATVGNHGRVSAKLDAQRDGENFEHYIPWFMKERLRDVPNIEFVDNTYHPEIITADILGNLIVGVHGDKDNPNSVAQDMSLMLDRVPYQVVVAHYHHNWEKEQTGGVDVIVNPSFCGADQYSIDHRKTSKAAQKLMIYTPEGRLCTYPIYLGGVR